MQGQGQNSEEEKKDGPIGSARQWGSGELPTMHRREFGITSWLFLIGFVVILFLGWGALQLISNVIKNKQLQEQSQQQELLLQQKAEKNEKRNAYLRMLDTGIFQITKSSTTYYYTESSQEYKLYIFEADVFDDSLDSSTKGQIVNHVTFRIQQIDNSDDQFFLTMFPIGKKFRLDTNYCWPDDSCFNYDFEKRIVDTVPYHPSLNGRIKAFKFIN